MWNSDPKTHSPAGNPLEEHEALKRKPAHELQNDPFARVKLEPESDKEMTALPEPAKLGNSVGEQGKNKWRDVAKVETMLGKTGNLDLKKTDGPTGYWGMRTSNATRKFQKKHRLKVDGQVKPGGETIRMLAKVAGYALKGLVQHSRVRPASKAAPTTKPQGSGDATVKPNNPLSAEAFQANRRAAQ